MDETTEVAGQRYGAEPQDLRRVVQEHEIETLQDAFALAARDSRCYQIEDCFRVQKAMLQDLLRRLSELSIIGSKERKVINEQIREIRATYKTIAGVMLKMRMYLDVSEAAEIVRQVVAIVTPELSPEAMERVRAKVAQIRIPKSQTMPDLPPEEM